MRPATTLLVILVAVRFGVGCSEDRAATPNAPPVYDVDVAPVLQRACAPCHHGASPDGSGLPVAGWPALSADGGTADAGRASDESAEAGWSVSSYLQTIACVAPSGAPAALPANGDAPILRALGSEAHKTVKLSATDRSTLEAWVAAGAPAFAATVHSPSFADPRSSGFHGAYLRSRRWAPMLDGNDPNACGRCHDGTPARPAGVTLPAPGAPACTSCHSQPEGVLACNTCHGTATQIYPPRDACFFPGGTGGAHRAHVEASTIHRGPSQAEAGHGTPETNGFACSTCHPSPPKEVIGGLHGNGSVDIVFDPKLVSPEASYDAKSNSCAVSCHDVGGDRKRWVWTDTTPVTCNDCHTSPPANHFPGACNTCHFEANATGTALSGGPLHLDGRIELGNGSGKCGACHGDGDSPWPATDAHAAHRDPSIAAPIACQDCHPVPSSILSPGHFQQGYVRFAFSGRATARGATPTWNGTSCENVACHGANLPSPPSVVPRWADKSGAAAACGACHAIPPSTNHTPSTECSRSDCHGTEVSNNAEGVPSITVSGRALHIDGVIEFNTP
jgi:predicted CxxxxCH...CXXCH cytochrome family protein